MSSIKSIFLWALLLIVTGCGFHLRGNVNWPEQYKTIYLSSFAQNVDRWSLLGVFERQLPKGITVVDSVEKADLRVQLLSETLQIRALSSSTYGQNKEETHYYSAVVQVTDRAGNMILPATTLSRQKDFSYNEGDLLGRSTGAQELRRELVSESALMLIRRLTAALKNSENH